MINIGLIKIVDFNIYIFKKELPTNRKKISVLCHPIRK